MKAILLLKGAGVSRADIASAVGLKSPKTVWHWERGSRHPNRVNVAKLAKLAKRNGIVLSLDDFMTPRAKK